MKTYKKDSDIIANDKWLGQHIAIHKIGDYIINEIKTKDGVRFCCYVKGENTSHMYYTMDSALAYCIAYKYEGCNTRANSYFMKSIGGN